MQETLKNRTIFCRDNLEVMRGIDNNTIDLIYLDPPFNKKKEFTAPIGSSAKGASFHDYFREGDIKEEWLGLIADKYPVMHDYIQGIGKIGHKSNKYYLCYMAVRLIEMHRILKDTGSLYVHCDQTMSHYLKLLLDCIFGSDNFRNEIIWCYSRPSAPKQRQLSRVHDTIFWYSFGKSWTFNPNPIRQPYAESSRSREGYAATASKVAEGNVELHVDGKFPESWVCIPMIKGNSKEYTGYPTQKPLALLERIIKASSNEGDVILDPFCGCATTCTAAEMLGRKWIGIDISKLAHSLVIKRLQTAADKEPQLFKGGKLPKIFSRKDIPNRTKQEVEIPKLELQKNQDKKHYLFGNQGGLCNGCKILFNYKNFEVDHIVPKAEGGGNEIANLQLLCGHCNRVKGDKDMPYLMKRLKEMKILR